MPRLLRLLAAVVLIGTQMVVSSEFTRAAGDGHTQIATVSHSSFHLRPQHERVQVTVDLAITNHIPTRGGVRTYLDEWRLYVLNGARDVKIRGAGASLRRLRKGDVATTYAVDFQRILRGQTRKLHMTYELPAARPRSDNRTRITEAYSHFCWHGQPSDAGSVRAVLPPNYEPTTHYGSVQIQRRADNVTLRARRKRDLGKFYACTDSFNSGRLVQQEIKTPDGQVITIQGWPEDPEWTTRIGEGIEESLPLLEELSGAPFPGTVVVRQVASQALGGYAGDFDRREGIVRVSETLDDPVLVAHELAHGWFNGKTMAETWMIEAHAEWLGHAANELWCPEKSAYPGKGKPDLMDWRYLAFDPSRRERAVVGYQYAAGCSMLEAIEKAAGIDAVRELNAALLARAPKYGGTVRDDAAKPDWREWLDAVDEVALVPAGVDDLRLAERMLIDEGIAKRKQLKGRAEARARYHEAMASSNFEFMPLFVRDAMDAWKFDRAMQALTVAEEALALAAASDQDQGTFLMGRTWPRLAQASSLPRVQEIRDELMTLDLHEAEGQTPVRVEDLVSSPRSRGPAAEAAPRLKTASDLIKRKHPKVTLAAFQKAYDRMMRDPEAQAAGSALQGRALDKAFKGCGPQGSGDGAKSQRPLVVTCEALVANAIFVYIRVPTPESWAAVQKGYDYFYTTRPRWVVRTVFNPTVRSWFEIHTSDH